MNELWALGSGQGALPPKVSKSPFMTARDQVLAEPRHGCGTGTRKLFQIRIEVPAFDSHELLRLQRMLKARNCRSVRVILSARATIISSGMGETGQPMAGFRTFLQAGPDRTVTWLRPPAAEAEDRTQSRRRFDRRPGSTDGH